jgi:hypothetical protein
MLKSYLHFRVHAALHNGQVTELTSLSTDRWLNKESVVYLHNGILLSLKREGNSVTFKNMELEKSTLSEKGGTERQIAHVLTYMWNLKQLNS